MMPRWSRAIVHFSRFGLQNNMEILKGNYFACGNYSKVAAAATVRTADSPVKDFSSDVEVNLNKFFWSKPCSLALAPDSPQRIEEPKYEGIRHFILKLLLFYSKQSKSIRGANVIYRRIVYQVDKPAIYNGVCMNICTSAMFNVFFVQWDELLTLPNDLSSMIADEIQRLVKEDVDRESLFSVFNLEKTFKTTFSLLVLHMWLCLRRLKEEGKEGVELGQYLYEIYNHDLELRVSKAGVNLLLIRWMKDLEKIFYGNIVAYDAAMLPEARQDELADAIWRNIFSDDGTPMPNDVASHAVQAMSRYARRESNCFKLTDKEAMFSGNFMFTSLVNLFPDSDR